MVEWKGMTCCKCRASPSANKSCRNSVNPVSVTEEDALTQSCSADHDLAGNPGNVRWHCAQSASDNLAIMQPN